MDTCSFEDCPAHVIAKDLCPGHYSQVQRGKPLKAIRRYASFADRFWARVDKSGECWIWTGFITHRGYGLASIVGAGGNETSKQAHRIAYEIASGPITDGRVVDHLCHTRACCNPAHLRLATAKQNAEHRIGAQANNKSSGVRGVYRQAGKWRAMVRHNQRLISVGMFATIAEAEAAVIAKRNELFTHNDMDRLVTSE